MIAFLIFDYYRQYGKYTLGLNILGNFMLLATLLPILIYRIRYRKSPTQYNPYTLKLDQIKVNENRSSRSIISSGDPINLENSMEMYLLNESEIQVEGEKKDDVDKYLKLNKQISNINATKDDKKNAFISDSSFASFEFEKMDNSEMTRSLKYDDVFRFPKNSVNSIAFVVNNNSKEDGDSDCHYRPIEMNSIHQPIIFSSKIKTSKND